MSEKKPSCFLGGKKEMVKKRSEEKWKGKT